MKSYKSQVTINRPPADVFPYLIEPQKQALWSDVPMRPDHGGPFPGRLEVRGHLRHLA